jgi:hypothetical protein
LGWKVIRAWVLAEAVDEPLKRERNEENSTG